jgi:hypothetical protein
VDADSTSVNVRLPRDLHARLKDLAAMDRRSLNAEIVWLLERAVDAEGRRP